MITLDLMDERNLYAADLDCDEHEGEPSEDNPLPVVWPTVWQVKRGKWACVLSEAEIVRLVVGCRHALKLPLGDKMRMGLQDTLEQAEEAKCQILRRRPVSGSHASPAWQNVDFLGLVEAQCGAGVQRGGQYWFKCFAHEDKTASLEVDAEGKRWHCFSCGKSGGVYAWKAAVSQFGSRTAHSHSTT